MGRWVWNGLDAAGRSCRSTKCTERQDVCHGLPSWYHDVNTFNTDSICFKMLGYTRIYLWFGQTMTNGNSCHQGSHQCTVWGKSSWVLQGQGNGGEMLNLAWFFMRWFFVACANWGHTLEEPGKGDSVAALVFVSAVAPSSVGILHSKMIPKCNMYLRCNNVGKIIPAYWCVVYRLICMILHALKTLVTLLVGKCIDASSCLGNGSRFLRGVLWSFLECLGWHPSSPRRQGGSCIFPPSHLWIAGVIHGNSVRHISAKILKVWSRQYHLTISRWGNSWQFISYPYYDLFGQHSSVQILQFSIANHVSIGLLRGHDMTPLSHETYRVRLAGNLAFPCHTLLNLAWPEWTSGKSPAFTSRLCKAWVLIQMICLPPPKMCGTACFLHFSWPEAMTRLPGEPLDTFLRRSCYCEPMPPEIRAANCRNT